MPGQKQYSKLPEIIFLNLSKTIEFNREEISWKTIKLNQNDIMQIRLLVHTLMGQEALSHRSLT